MDGKNIKLRALEPIDIEVLYQWENDTEVWKVSNTQTPFSRHTLEQYINAPQDIYATKQLRLMIESKCDTPQAVGCIDLFDFDPNHKRAGIGILIDKKHRNNGYAAEAIDLMVEYAFIILDVHQLYCNICPDNEKSLKLFQDKGFEIAGNKKDWIRNGDTFIDEYLLQKIKN